MIEQEKTDIDKGEISSESLVDLFIDFGFFPKNMELPKVSLEDLMERNGDTRNELVYLMDEDVITVDNGRVSLKSSERDIAEKLVEETITNNLDYEINEILDKSWIPKYLSEPEIKEDYSPVLEKFDQEPNQEISTRIIEILDDQSLKPRQVEEELSGYINFDLESRMRYLETIDVLERKENNRYSLAEDVPEELSEQGFNLKDRMKEQQRYGNNPWKT